jgi:hypothetical protein
MKLFSRLASIALCLGLATGVAAQSLSPTIVLLKNFQLHDFDKSIMDAMTQTTGNILYWREMGSITDDQTKQMHASESIGCNPFYYMKDGAINEAGYNCRSFFCVGYLRGPKVCRDINGQPYGGIVEIERRQTAVQVPPKKVYFKDFSEAVRPAKMTERINSLSAVRCRPYYMIEFNDTAVAEGYECDEVGQYPYYSPKNNCLNDWKTNLGYVCDNPIRDNEYDIRLEALGVSANLGKNSSSSKRSAGSSASSVSSRSARSSSSSSSSSSFNSASVVGFTDLAPTDNAYAAVAALQLRGIISGYPDGTFRPQRSVNRAEWLKMLIPAFRFDAEQKPESCFSDVSTEWFSPFVCAAKRLAWVVGYPDGTFRPDTAVNRAEAIKMLINAMNVPPVTLGDLPSDVPADSWFAPYVRTATVLGIFSPAYPFHPEAPLTRADAAMWIQAGLK